ncbi:MAG TPA: EAL domain-containing protein [Nevskiaceae bacterium]|nr:EAL domain-containing protein [Nevskiaceae bacterium]
MKSQSRQGAEATFALQPLHSLQVKLGALFAGLMLVVGAAAWWVGGLLVRDELVEESFRYEVESGLRLTGEVERITDRTEDLARQLATLVPEPPALAASLVPRLLQQEGSEGLLHSVGIWMIGERGSRQGRLWLRDSSGQFPLREDYNDPRSIAYLNEPWFTPALYARDGRCYWTPVYRELLSRQEVISCSLPVYGPGGVRAVVTASLSRERLASRFATLTASQPGYSLLVMRDGRLLAGADRAAQRWGDKPPHNLAELAQREPAYNSLALRLHRRDEEFQSRSVQSALYDAGKVSELKERTRELTRPEAERALAQLWNRESARSAPAPEQMALERDAVLEAAAYASVFELPVSGWQLIRVTSAEEGFSGARYLFTQTLVVIGGGLAIAWLLLFGGLRWLVIRPLRRMTAELSSAGSSSDSLQVQLDERPRNELGLLAHWYNERVRQLREFMDQAIATNAQLVVEADERQRAQLLLAQTQERSQLALHSVLDGVLFTDDRGRIEELNRAAEQLTGTAQREARGQPLDEVLRARVGGENGSPMPNLAELAVSRGTRLDYSEGLFLALADGSSREIALSATPVRLRNGRSMGCVVVVRPRVTAGASRPSRPAVEMERRQSDRLTGLSTRRGCELRLRELADRAPLQKRQHVLAEANLDHFRRLNELHGREAGDALLVRSAELLAASTEAEVFRLALDRFALILSDVDVETATARLETARQRLADSRFPWGEQGLTLTASFGLLPFSDGQHSPGQLLDRAEAACQQAKRAGRNRVAVYQHSDSRASQETEDAEWIRRLQAGIDQNLLQLRTQWLQPSAAYAAEGQVFELLLALEDEEGFWTAPSAFLASAERHHLTPELDRWVIRRTLGHLTRHPDLAERLAFCSINLAAATLADGSLLDFLAEQFAAHPEVAPRKICFELRESAFVDQARESELFCEVARRLGCRVAIDHFSGRSAREVALVQRLQVDFLKVDAGAYRDLAHDPIAYTLADSVVRLARGLRRRLVVCNIGDSAALEAWRKLGVDYAQGFAVAKPSPIVFHAPLE